MIWLNVKVASQPNGVRWLYSWLRNPAAYHPRTIMPNVLLEPVTHEDGSVSDPAADAVAYLLQSTKADPVVLDNKDCRFQPHVGFVQTGQTLTIKNSDAVGHNSNIATMKNSPSNSLVPARTPDRVSPQTRQT